MLKEEINKLLQSTYYDIEKGEPKFDPTFEPGILDDILSLIRTHLLKAIPKEVDSVAVSKLTIKMEGETKETYIRDSLEARFGWNQAISKARKVIKEELK